MTRERLTPTPNEQELLGKFRDFSGDCDYCQCSTFSFGPRGGAGRMLECTTCGAQFIWMPMINAVMDNDAFRHCPDGARRR